MVHWKFKRLIAALSIFASIAIASQVYAHSDWQDNQSDRHWSDSQDGDGSDSESQSEDSDQSGNDWNNDRGWQDGYHEAGYQNDTWDDNQDDSGNWNSDRSWGNSRWDGSNNNDSGWNDSGNGSRWNDNQNDSQDQNGNQDDSGGQNAHQDSGNYSQNNGDQWNYGNQGAGYGWYQNGNQSGNSGQWSSGNQWSVRHGEATLNAPLFVADSRLQFQWDNKFSITVDGNKVSVDVLDPSMTMQFATASIDGAQQVPAVNTPAKWSALFMIDTDKNELRYVISYNGLSGGNEISAHIHGPAAPGQNAGIMQPLPLGNFKVGTWKYDEAQEQAILSGNTYVNIHSQKYPDGEIRGQIVPIRLNGSTSNSSGSGNAGNTSNSGYDNTGNTSSSGY